MDSDLNTQKNEQKTPAPQPADPELVIVLELMRFPNIKKLKAGRLSSLAKAILGALATAGYLAPGVATRDKKAAAKTKGA